MALARVIAVDGSAPRSAGAAMAVNDGGDVAGSVSGGCVEGALHGDALAVLGSGDPRLATYGISDDEAFGVGLTCGGTLHVFVEPIDDRCILGFDAWSASDQASDPGFVWVTQVRGPDPGATLTVGPGDQVRGSLGDERLDDVAVRDARAELTAGRTGLRHYGTQGEARRQEVEVFVHAFDDPPRMIIFGAVDFTASLTQVATLLGYRVSVVDPREVFATAERFPAAHEVVSEWPDRYLARVGAELGPRDAVCVLTHDHRFDVPAITAALETAVGYIGAMGSRRTHDERMGRLRSAEIDAEELERLWSPIGLDLGATTPEETAVSICAEIVAVNAGRSAPSLRDATGPIHPREG